MPRDKEARKSAKKIIKIAKKNPQLYTPEEVAYAKLVKRLNKKRDTD